ncbi:MAG: DUF2272 domain-containing protein [Pseudolabrys sp.]
MRAVVCLVVAALALATDPSWAQSPLAQSTGDGAAFWKSVQAICDATAAKPSGETAKRIARVAIEEFGRFGGHRIDSDGRIVDFGQTEAEQSPNPTAELQDSVGKLAWWRVKKYWQALFGDSAPDKLEVLGFGDATAKTDDKDVTPLIRTTAARLLKAAEAETDPETREVLREAAWRLAIIDTPWSAAFISYVVRQAGAADKSFRFSNAHRGYIYDAFATGVAEAAGKDDAHFYRACPVYATVPRAGDIICHQRERALTNSSDGEVRELIRTELASGGETRSVRSTHCEVVAFIDAPARKLYTVSGNVNQSVSARKLNLRADMKLSATQGHCGGPGHWTLPKSGSRVAADTGDKPASLRSTAKPREQCSLNDSNWFVLLQAR